MRIAAAIVLFALGLAEIAAAAPPRLLVLNKNDNELVVVDVSTRQILGRAPTGRAPHEVAASDDGKLAFASNYGVGDAPGNSLSVIDLETMAERKVDLGPIHRPHGLDFADGKLYFTAEANKLIGRYDPKTDRVDWLMGTGQNGSHMVALSKDRDALFATNIGSNTVSVFGRPGGGDDWSWTQTIIPVGAGPEGFDVSPDGKQLWVAHSRDGHVSIIDLAARKVAQVFDAGTQRSNRLKFTPDGETVLISDLAAGDLVIVDAASRTVTKRLPLGRALVGILIPPDGSVAYVAAQGENYVSIVDLKTYNLVGRVETGNGPDGMAWIAGD